MKKFLHVIMVVSLMAVATETFTSCAGMQGTVTSAQTWLNDPKNQRLIQEIAAAANILIGAFGESRSATTRRVTVVGKLAVDYPNVPAGALSAIAQSPASYLKR